VSIKIKGNNSNFEACPEFTGKAVCVDVTPLRKQQSQFGERDVFKLVFEVDLDKPDGSRCCVWSQNFTPSLNEKANFRKYLRAWFGRDLMESEMAEFDTETLIGKPAQLVVVHEHKDGQVYANIAACTPDKSGAALKPSGKFTRRKDRDSQEQGAGSKEGNGGGGYRRAAGPQDHGTAGQPDHGAVKVHVGKYAGIELRDLNPEAVQALVEKWLPTAKANAKPTADDKRLVAALEWWAAEKAKADDDVPY
jgi:hypothetical protein